MCSKLGLKAMIHKEQYRKLDQFENEIHKPPLKKLLLCWFSISPTNIYLGKKSILISRISIDRIHSMQWRRDHLGVHTHAHTYNIIYLAIPGYRHEKQKIKRIIDRDLFVLYWRL